MAFAHVLDESAADAVVVVDADTVVSPNLLSAFAARIAGGAAGLQANSLVSNEAGSWRTRLMALALATFHDLRSLGRERFCVSSGLRGNGMCVSLAALLQRERVTLEGDERLAFARACQADFTQPVVTDDATPDRVVSGTRYFLVRPRCADTTEANWPSSMTAVISLKHIHQLSAGLRQPAGWLALRRASARGP